MLLAIHIITSHTYPSSSYLSLFFFFNDTATTEIYTLSLHDALPDLARNPHDQPGNARQHRCRCGIGQPVPLQEARSEEHTSELQSRRDLVCRLLLEKKKKKNEQSCNPHHTHIYVINSSIIYSNKRIY